jgi:hypothetical protein
MNPLPHKTRKMKKTYDFTKTPDANFAEFFKPKKKASTKAELKRLIAEMHQLINEI